MRLKLDENLGERGRKVLTDAGHDVATVSGQGMAAAEDEELIGACKAEDRALVTLDLDSANPVRFPPREFAGIAVLRLPRRPGADDLSRRFDVLARALASEVLKSHLWIVEQDRIRIYQPN